MDKLAMTNKNLRIHFDFIFSTYQTRVNAVRVRLCIDVANQRLNPFLCFHLLFPVGGRLAVALSQVSLAPFASLIRSVAVIHTDSPTAYHRPIRLRLQGQFRSGLPVFNVKAIRS